VISEFGRFLVRSIYLGDLPLSPCATLRQPPHDGYHVRVGSRAPTLLQYLKVFVSPMPQTNQQLKKFLLSYVSPNLCGTRPAMVAVVPSVDWGRATVGVV
jgi:hypothetical protein